MRAGWSFLVFTTLVAVHALPASAQLVRVSVSTAGAQANGHSYSPSISGDGRLVAFSSEATNLVEGDSNDASDVFLRDRDTDADGVFDEADSVATTRVSVGPGGVQANGHSVSPVLSADGRFVTFNSTATNLVAGLIVAAPQIYQFDRVTGTTSLVSANGLGQPSDGACFSPAASGDGRFVVFACVTTNLVAGDPGFGGSILLRDMTTTGVTRMSLPQPPATPAIPNISDRIVYSVASPAISLDGLVIAFSEVESRNLGVGAFPFVSTGRVTIVDRQSGSAMRSIASGTEVKLSGDGARFFAFTGPISLGFGPCYWQQTAVGEPIAIPAFVAGIGDVSSDGRYAVLASPIAFVIYDATYRRGFDVPYGSGLSDSGGLDAAAHTLVFSSSRTNLPIAGGDTNNLSDVFVVDLRQFFDQDHDSLDDRDETFFGLSASSANGADGPAGDPDGDGLSNAEELAAGTHPRGFVRRYLAEGAAGSFFRTQIALANPDAAADHDASASLTFLRSDGVAVNSAASVTSLSRRTIDAAMVTGLGAADFSTVIESDRPLVVDRTMTWDTRSPLVPSGYGAHTETATEAPAGQWYLAEGSTVLDFQLFYLLQNPQNAAVTATVRFLRPIGAPIERLYTLPPHSRTTIYVNEADPALAETDVSGVIDAAAPIIVERAMYANRPGQVFGLGHAAKGVTAPATNWFLAEGATGTFFDTYVLVANPSSTAATIEARFDKPDGSSVTRTYNVAAASRFSIYVDAIAGLEATSVATTITSTNAVPILVERAMYWPGSLFDYYEGHSSAGATATGLRWALAEGESGGARDARTYVLIANTASAAGRARVTQMYEAQESTTLEIDLPPNSRTTVPLGGQTTVPTRFGTLVESIGPSPVPIVVEGAFYWTVDGTLFAAGSNVVATRLP